MRLRSSQEFGLVSLRGWLRLALALLLASCDPAAGVTLRQSLVPAPGIDCVREALAASPLVAQVAASHYYPKLREHMLRIVLHDSVAPRHARQPVVTLIVPRTDTAALEVHVGIFGATTGRLSQESVDRLRAAGRLVAAVVQQACARSSPSTVQCVVEGFGRSRPCDPPA